MTNEQPDYLSYLLRLWRVNGDELHRSNEPHRGDELHRSDELHRRDKPRRMEEQGFWRASLESSHTGERKGFAGLNDLFDFLRAQTGEPAEDMVKRQPDYLAYLLRLWRVSDDAESVPKEKTVWQASLENTQTGERKFFTSLDGLFTFLREQTRMSSDS